MALFYEVDIPQDKPVLYAIQKLYGIGSSEAFQFCNELGIGRDVIVSELAKDEWQSLIQAIEKHGVFEIHRRRQVRKSVESLIEIKCHQAKKHIVKSQ
jgi:small subunit ribosomal protein S13